MNLKPGYYIVIVVVAILLLFAGYVYGATVVRRDLQAQAIKGGHAAWRVIDEHGNVTFEWAANHPGEKGPVVEKKP